MVWKKMRIEGKNKKRAFFCGCLLFLPLLQFLIFYVCVNINAIVLSFQIYDSGSATFIFAGFDTMKNAFFEIFTFKNWGVAFGNSFILFFLNLIIKTPLTLIVSFFIYKKARLGGWIKVIFYAPAIMSTMVTVIIYEYFVDQALPQLVNNIFGTNYVSFITNEPSSFITIFLFGYWCGFGTSLLLFTNAMTSISPSIVEAAQLDGETFFGELVHITFPMIFSTFKMTLLVSVTGIFAYQFNLFEFFGLEASTGLQTVGYYLYKRTVGQVGVSGFPQVSALGLWVTFVAVPLALGARYLLNKLDPMEK